MPCSFKQDNFLSAAADMVDNILGALNCRRGIVSPMNDQGRNRNMRQTFFGTLYDVKEFVNGKKRGSVIYRIGGGGNIRKVAFGFWRKIRRCF